LGLFLLAGVALAQQKKRVECKINPSKPVISDCYLHIKSPWVVTKDVELRNVNVTCDYLGGENEACIVVKPNTKFTTHKTHITGKPRNTGCFRVDNAKLTLKVTEVRNCTHFAVKAGNQSSLTFEKVRFVGNMAYNKDHQNTQNHENVEHQNNNAIVTARRDFNNFNSFNTFDNLASFRHHESEKPEQPKTTDEFSVGLVRSEDTEHLKAVIHTDQSEVYFNATSIEENWGLTGLFRNSLVNISYSQIIYNNNTFGNGTFHVEKTIFNVKYAKFNNNTAHNAAALYVLNTTAHLEAVEFIHNHAHELGGVIKAERSQVHVNTSGFEENRAELGGGAICLNEAELNITRSHLKYNFAHYGGAVASYKAKIHVEESEMLNNIATEGGAFYVYESELRTKEFRGNHNKATKCGGFVKTNHSRVHFYESEFLYNRAGKMGAVVNATNSEVRFDVSRFVENYAGYGGGVVGLFNTSLHFNTTHFSKNNAPHGGVVCGKYVIVNIRDTEFVNNTGRAAGAIELLDAELKVNDTSFEGTSGNTVYLTGTRAHFNYSKFSHNFGDDGTLVSSNSTVTLHLVELEHNWNVEHGAVYGNFTTFLIERSRLNHNHAFKSGGAVAVYRSTLEMKVSDISNNTATSGGAICSWYSHVDTWKVRISNNTANQYGGGLRLKDSRASIKECELSHNKANDGGVYHGSNSTLSLHRSMMNNNEATLNGGVISGNNALMDVHTVNITNNTASNGGFVFCHKCSLTVNNASFTYNLAHFNGGCVDFIDSNVGISHSHFYYNLASYGGVVHSDKGTIDFEHSEFVHNQAVHGGVFNIDYTILDVYNSTFTDNGDMQGVSFDAENSIVTFRKSHGVHQESIASTRSSFTNRS